MFLRFSPILDHSGIHAIAAAWRPVGGGSLFFRALSLLWIVFHSFPNIPKTNDQKMGEDPLSRDLPVIFIEPCRVPSFCQNVLTPRTQRPYVRLSFFLSRLSHFA